MQARDHRPGGAKRPGGRGRDSGGRRDPPKKPCLSSRRLGVKDTWRLLSTVAVGSLAKDPASPLPGTCPMEMSVQDPGRHWGGGVLQPCP